MEWRNELNITYKVIEGRLNGFKRPFFKTKQRHIHKI